MTRLYAKSMVYDGFLLRRGVREENKDAERTTAAENPREGYVARRKIFQTFNKIVGKWFLL